MATDQRQGAKHCGEDEEHAWVPSGLPCDHIWDMHSDRAQEVG